MSTAQIAVLGAGPAGAAAAVGLARMGEDVVLIGEPRRFDAVEGVSQRVVDALHSLGFEAALQHLAPPSARSARWNSVLSTANSERLLKRQDFERALLDDLNRLGVAVVHGHIQEVDSTQPGRHVIRVVADGQERTLQAAFLVEARGRAAPAKGAPRVRGAETVSLLQYWQGAPGAAHSAVQSCADGWAWMAALADGRRYLQLTMDAHSATLPQKKELGAYCRARFAELEAAAPFLRDAAPVGEPYARASTPILNAVVCGADWIRIGDAAMAVDPLSGNGIFQALSSALQAPAVVATLLHAPQDAALASEFHHRRIEELFYRFARIGRDFYREETQWPQSAFWANRRDWPDAQPLHAAVTPASTFVAQRPVVRDDRIITAEVVVNADQPLGIWHVDGVPMAPLLQAIRRHPPEADAVAVVHAECGLERQRAAHFVAWMRKAGWID